MALNSETCSWCKHRTGAHTWRDMCLCAGCWIDLTVDEYLRAWSTDPQVGRALTYRGIPLAATLEYDLLQELIAVFGKIVGGGPRSVVAEPDATKRVPPDHGASSRT